MCLLFSKLRLTKGLTRGQIPHSRKSLLCQTLKDWFLKVFENPKHPQHLFLHSLLLAVVLVILCLNISLKYFLSWNKIHLSHQFIFKNLSWKNTPLSLFLLLLLKLNKLKLLVPLPLSIKPLPYLFYLHLCSFS